MHFLVAVVESSLYHTVDLHKKSLTPGSQVVLSHTALKLNHTSKVFERFPQPLSKHSSRILCSLPLPWLARQTQIIGVEWSKGGRMWVGLRCTWNQLFILLTVLRMHVSGNNSPVQSWWNSIFILLFSTLACCLTNNILPCFIILTLDWFRLLLRIIFFISHTQPITKGKNRW